MKVESASVGTEGHVEPIISQPIISNLLMEV